MILAIKQPSTIKGKGFEFQVCNNDGQLLTEALHNVPNDSSIIEEKGNTVNHVIRNTNTNGYILVGSGPGCQTMVYGTLRHNLGF